MKADSGRKRTGALAGVLLVFLGTLLLVEGCEKNGPDREEKKTPVVEEKEGKREEGKTGVVLLAGEKLRGAGIKVQKARKEAVSAPLSATAAIEFNGDRIARVSSRVAGRIRGIRASQGDRVEARQTLVYLDTVELNQAWAEYIKAKGRRELVLKNLKREETLYEKKISPEKDVLKARQELSEVEADLALAKERFRILGIDLTQMEEERSRGVEGPPLIPISSSIGGVVVERSVSHGEVVSPDKVLFTVADLANLWVLIDIYERDLPRLKTGMMVKVSVAAYPDRDFKGSLSYISDVMDEKTRTVKARVTIDNSSGLLKPGMFATVSMEAFPDSQAEKIIAVPAEAILMEGSTRYVFVQIGKDQFQRTDITVGRTIGGRVEVTGGLKEGDPVVLQGAFVLKSELKKKSLQAE